MSSTHQYTTHVVHSPSLLWPTPKQHRSTQWWGTCTAGHTYMYINLTCAYTCTCTCIVLYACFTCTRHNFPKINCQQCKFNIHVQGSAQKIKSGGNVGWGGYGRGSTPLPPRRKILNTIWPLNSSTYSYYYMHSYLLLMKVILNNEQNQWLSACCRC